MRASMLCGWMEPEQWAPSLLGEFDIDGQPYSPPICPGWTIRQPLIADIAGAWKTFEKGNFDAFFPEASNVLCEGVLILDAAIALHQRRELEDRNR